MQISTRVVFVTGLVLLTLLSVARALEPTTAPNGIGWITGGIGAGERTELASIESSYSLKIVLAARRDTAYVADATFTIRDAGGNLVLEGQANGPWVLVELPPGEYTVAATSRGQTQSESASIPTGGSTRVVLYFDRG